MGLAFPHIGGLQKLIYPNGSASANHTFMAAYKNGEKCKNCGYYNQKVFGSIFCCIECFTEYFDNKVIMLTKKVSGKEWIMFMEKFVENCSSK